MVLTCKQSLTGRDTISYMYLLTYNLLVALQGLFHPARKVRDVYWKVYNTCYIGAQDAMVPAYPRIQNDDKNNYIRYELDYVL